MERFPTKRPGTLVLVNVYLHKSKALFGENFWQFTIIGVSHWAYDQQSIAQRNFTGKTEEGYMKEWNSLLKEKFHIDAEIEGVFIDAWSQQPWNIQDENQQEQRCKEETGLSAREGLKK